MLGAGCGSFERASRGLSFARAARRLGSMSSPAPDRSRLASAWVLSVAAHGAMAAAGLIFVAAGIGRTQRSAHLRHAERVQVDVVIEIELPVMSEGSLVGRALPTELAPVPPHGGIDGVPRPDSGRRGRGGTDEVSESAQNLADQDDAVTLTRGVMTRLDRHQLNRIRASSRRAARENWRASREPMELTFLVTGGQGSHAERRPSADHDPGRGAWGASAPNRRGGEPGAARRPPGQGLASRELGSSIVGGSESSPGAGMPGGAWSGPHQDAAALAHARPLVDRGTPSVPASTRGRPSDTMDSEDEVAHAIRSIVHASTAGGRDGHGPGGQRGPGRTGSGGTAGPGSSSVALGNGRGGRADPGSPDARKTLYLTKMWGKIWPRWSHALPTSDALAGHGASTVISFTLDGQGNVTRATVVRASGIAAFDENVRRAVLSAGPYGPLPSGFGPTLSHSFPFTMDNPAVRPKTVSKTSKR